MEQTPQQVNLAIAQGVCELHSHHLGKRAEAPVASPAAATGSSKKRRGRRQPNPITFRPRTGVRELVGEAALTTGATFNGFITDAVEAAALRILSRPARGKPLPKRADRAELAAILAALGKVGSNVNQMAHVANATQQLPALSVLRSTSVELQRLADALLVALR